MRRAAAAGFPSWSVATSGWPATVPLRGSAIVSAWRVALKTETQLCCVGYHIDQDPAPIMVVMPTERDAETWSKDRFSPMARDTPCLQGKKLPKRLDLARDADRVLDSVPGLIVANWVETRF